ncbi:MAG: hypothetical protein OXC82_03375 [Rhodobacteraceae bacterium]|nr:hypothetical protein [Paracoccaceae bacterium]MCY4249463.1 hypothetical protein [Paracoccaceae bacterium]MCY4308256.1 hypothetical protein [Paracoccaceae bacterium]
MKTKTSIRVSVDLVPDFHAEVKARAQASAKTLKTYVKDVLAERIHKDREEEEDRYWGERAKEAREEGFVSVEESEAYLKHLLDA